MTKAPAIMEGFEHLVPGWSNRVAHPYNLLIGAGIRKEMERLRGARYLVVVLHRLYDYGGLFEELFLDAGFVDPVEASEHALRVRERHYQAIQKQHPDWHPLNGPLHLWPSREPSGAKLLRLDPMKLGDGTGYNSGEIHTAVLPLDPDQPLSAELFELINQSTELNAYFRDVGRS